jgi:hypothetical protein
VHVRGVVALRALLAFGAVCVTEGQAWAQAGVVEVHVSATKASPQFFLLIARHGVVTLDMSTSKPVGETKAAPGRAIDTLRLVTPVSLTADLKLGGVTLIPDSGQIRADLLLFNGSTMNAVADKVIMGREGNNIFVRGVKK